MLIVSIACFTIWDIRSKGACGRLRLKAQFIVVKRKLRISSWPCHAHEATRGPNVIMSIASILRGGQRPSSMKALTVWVFDGCSRCCDAELTDYGFDRDLRHTELLTMIHRCTTILDAVPFRVENRCHLERGLERLGECETGRVSISKCPTTSEDLKQI
jgi:hypothetical protein